MKNNILSSLVYETHKINENININGTKQQQQEPIFPWIENWGSSKVRSSNVTLTYKYKRIMMVSWGDGVLHYRNIWYVELETAWTFKWVVVKKDYVVGVIAGTEIMGTKIIYNDEKTSNVFSSDLEY